MRIRFEGSPRLVTQAFRSVCYAAVVVLTIAASTAIAHAQETPAPESTPTWMDRQYDGNLHITAAPYIWGPTVKANLQFSIPTLPHARGHGGGVLQSSFEAGPSDYVPKLNSAVMFAFDARKGGIDIFGDYIYLNATSTANIFGTLTGPRGNVQIPVSIAADARLRASIWEAAAGFTVARGHNADLSIITGMRGFPLTLSFGYSALIGKRGILAPTGSIAAGQIAQDVIVGLRGKAYFGDDRWFVPYYVDVGTGIGQLGNQTWEGYTGAGYTFNHGQTLVALYRTLNYYALPPVSNLQKLSMYGPLLGYTFNL
jgi:hypothetical protein